MQSSLREDATGQRSGQAVGLAGGPVSTLVRPRRPPPLSRTRPTLSPSCSNAHAIITCPVLYRAKEFPQTDD